MAPLGRRQCPGLSLPIPVMSLPHPGVAGAANRRRGDTPTPVVRYPIPLTAGDCASTGGDVRVPIDVPGRLSHVSSGGIAVGPRTSRRPGSMVVGGRRLAASATLKQPIRFGPALRTTNRVAAVSRRGSTSKLVARCGVHRFF